MPHSIDFDFIEARLFTLHHAALGSRDYCKRFNMSRQLTNSSEYESIRYVGNLKALVSGTMIDAAIKIRMLQDFARRADSNFDVITLQSQASKNLNIGRLEPNNAPLLLRDACNKIIHATRTKLLWHDVESNKNSYMYWGGEYELSGCARGEVPWTATINVPDWCTAMTRFNSGFQKSIDWACVLKPDG